MAGDKKPLFPIFHQAAKRAKEEEEKEKEKTTQPTQATPVDNDCPTKKRKSNAGGGVNASASTPASAPRTQGSSFVVCPVCFGSVARALVDAHVAGCLALQRQAQVEAAAAAGTTREEQKQQQQRPPEAAAAETSTGATPASEQQQQPSLRPLSQVLRPQRISSALAAAAAPSVPPAPQRGGGSVGGGGAKRTATAAAAAAALAPPPLSQQAPPQPPAAAAAAAAGASAFAELMRAQRSAAKTHVFYLEIRGESFFWHWGEVKGSSSSSSGGGGGKTAAGGASSTPTLPPGLPPAAWTAELSIPLPAASGSRQKVTIRLATNLHPGPQQFKSFDRGKPTFPPAACENGPSSAAPVPPPPASSQPLPPVFPRLAPSLLKSALQKNVRLGRAASAVRVAAHLLRQGEAGELLRRLPVIALEDASLTPALPLAVWMMAAFSKGWDPLPAAAERAILKFVHSLACCRVRDDAELFEGEEEEEEEEEEKGGAQKKNKRLDVASLFTSSSSSSSFDLDPQAALLVRVLHLRAAFGGMPCDVAMMRSAAGTWLRRFAGRGGVPPPPMTTAAAAAATATANNTAPPPSPCALWLSFLWRSFSPPLVQPLALPPAGASALAAVGRMTQEDVPLSAVDFHVSSIAEELLNLPAVAREAGKAARAVGESENDQEASEERLRRAMWLFRSSRNVRSPGGSGSGSSLTSTSTSTAAASAVVVYLNGDTPRARALRARSASERDDLRPLWRAAAAAADSWSSEFLRQRFGGRRRF